MHTNVYKGKRGWGGGGVNMTKNTHFVCIMIVITFKGPLHKELGLLKSALKKHIIA